MAFNNQGPTIPIVPVGELGFGDNGGTPAIQALQNAFQSGAVDFDTINKHFGDAPRMAAEKLANQAKIVASKGDIAIQPIKNEVAALTGDVAIQQAKNNLALMPGVVAAEKAKQDEAASLRQQVDDARPLGLHQRVQEWQAAGLGKLPDDMEEFVRITDSIQKAKIKAATGTGTEKLESAELRKRGIELGIPVVGRPDADIEADIVVATKTQREQPKPLTPTQRLDETEAIQASEQLASRMKNAGKLLFQTDEQGNIKRDASGAALKGPRNLVGGGAGSVAGQGVNLFKELVGFPEDRAGFRELEMLTNDLTASKTRLLKGPLSEKELAFIKASVPRPTDDESVWDKYLRENLPVLEESISARRTSINTGKPVQLPASGAADPLDDEEVQKWKVAVPVSTTKDWSRLPVGTYYVSGGNLYQKQP